MLCMAHAAPHGVGCAISSTLATMLPDELLARVQGPARYIGSEFNAVHKDPATVDLRVVMCYPDVYEVGMSHLGLHVLCHVINRRPDAWCERAFHPHPDATALLRERAIPLHALESGDPLAACDVIGITLQHELTYASVLSLLDLGGVPVPAEERGAGDPVVLGGGPCALNPAPMAAFFDAFVMGDGEEAVHEALDAIKRLRGAGRRKMLEGLAELDGLYVPQVHDPATARIARRIVADLDAAPFPTRPVVPWVEVVHDRAQVEIARGCTRGCRFCQAGMIYRPVRERSAETVRCAAGEIIRNTGHDEVALVSLNCPDYVGIEALIDGLHRDLGRMRVSVGLPSLRVDTFSVGLAAKVQRVRKSGLTFAPEAGSQRLRDAVNKGVTEADLVAAARAAFEAGWTTLKLYFMIGLPTETEADVLAIPELTRTVARVGRETLGPRASRMRINVSVANFVPKPHTPFQWEGQVGREELRRRQGLLREAIRDRQVSLSCHDADQSAVEAALARGGRATADAVLAAFGAGAFLDAEAARFDFALWQRAFAAAGLDLDAEATRRFSPDERLPWEHIDAGPSREFLLRECERAVAGEPTGDCRQTGCGQCGVARLAPCATPQEAAC